VSFRTRLRPELLNDAAAAFAWYQEKSEGLGYEFFRAFFAAVARVKRNPALFRKAYSDFRRVLLRRFPYCLYYRIENETIIFFLLFHSARNPTNLRRELRQRKRND